MTEAEMLEELWQDVRSPARFRDDIGPEEAVEIRGHIAYRTGQAERKLARLRERGTSFLDDPDSGEEYIKGNRAGENEEELTADQIIERYA
jgi:hypothetical protein